ncbi:hypothetical protein BA059_20835 [Mycolicibacterium sp. (ex Dasyatis americana)]|nr:hypothetical protein BA059_20835 [Mycolicibacterium sp. (ex Dasyatis americana)]
MTDVSNEIDKIAGFTWAVGAGRSGETLGAEICKIERVHAFAHFVTKGKARRRVDQNVVSQKRHAGLIESRSSDRDTDSC